MSSKTGGSATTPGASTDPPEHGPAALRGILDVLVYAPIGFAISAGTLVPELAAKGRARARDQVRLARMIGQFAVPVVRRKGEQLVRQQVAKASRSERPDRASGATPEPRPAPERTTAPPPKPARASSGSGPRPARLTRPVPAPAADLLPIEGYDELPASSIVTLLEGLRPAQLRALDAHERSNRARRTVLTRIAQLLA